MIKDLKNDFKNDQCDTFKALYQLAASVYCVTLTADKKQIIRIGCGFYVKLYEKVCFSGLGCI